MVIIMVGMKNMSDMKKEEGGKEPVLIQNELG
jgi:hypothetical protein